MGARNKSWRDSEYNAMAATLCSKWAEWCWAAIADETKGFNLFPSTVCNFLFWSLNKRNSSWEFVVKSKADSHFKSRFSHLQLFSVCMVGWDIVVTYYCCCCCYCWCYFCWKSFYFFFFFAVHSSSRCLNWVIWNGIFHRFFHIFAKCKRNKIQP